MPQGSPFSSTVKTTPSLDTTFCSERPRLPQLRSLPSPRSNTSSLRVRRRDANDLHRSRNEGALPSDDGRRDAEEAALDSAEAAGGMRPCRRRCHISFHT